MDTNNKDHYSYANWDPGVLENLTAFPRIEEKTNEGKAQYKNDDSIEVTIESVYFLDLCI